MRAEQTETRKKCWVQKYPLLTEGKVKERKHRLATLRTLDHPHVLRMLDLLQDKDHYYAVYEAIEGGNAELLCA